jgi:hypothetical protein
MLSLYIYLPWKKRNVPMKVGFFQYRMGFNRFDFIVKINIKILHDIFPEPSGRGAGTMPSCSGPDFMWPPCIFSKHKFNLTYY